MVSTKTNAFAVNVPGGDFNANSYASNIKVPQTSSDFGDVLNKASEKINTSGQENGKKQEAFSMSKGAAKNDKTYENMKTDKPRDISEDQAADAQPDKTKEKMPEDFESTKIEEDPDDEMKVEKIADALQQIIEQIKDILGVDDEEILIGMENIGMEPLDFLDSANMAQLVTAVAGEESTISLVANEELYAALQEVTEVVENVSAKLLEDTGLTQEELDIILERLEQMEEGISETAGEPQEAKIIPFERPEAMDGKINEDLADTTDDSISEVQDKTPVIITEDKTQVKPDENSSKEFSDNISENIAEDNTLKPETQKQEDNSQHKAGHDNDAKDFGHQDLQQNFQNDVNQVEQTTVLTEGYTTESTADIIRQLADFVKIVKNENLTEMEMQLHPASLGTVNVSLTTKAGVVTAHFTTQNEAVKEAIAAQAAELKTNLEEQGVKVEAVEVSVGSHQMERNLDKDSGQQQRQQEEDEKRIRAMRKNSINFNSFVNDEEIEEEMLEADDATRIAMEIMAANGNSMDLLA